MFSRRTFIAGVALVAGALGCHREGTQSPSGERLAPEFTGVDAGGQELTLAGMLSGGPAVLVFYRGFW